MRKDRVGGYADRLAPLAGLDEADQPVLSDQVFNRVRELMKSAIGLALPDNRKPMVASRLYPRMKRLGLATFDAYVDLIDGDDAAGEFQMAVDLLTTNETYFFREPRHFELLEQLVVRARPEGLDVWSAASSFGDEAYSIAMTLADQQMYGRIGKAWSILGTDISDRVLRTAIAAVFPEERLRDVSDVRRLRYCLRGVGPAEGMVRIQEVLRDRVRFGQLNLCEPFDDGFGPFDVAFLRNVLFYFDAPTRLDIVDRVLEKIRPGGLLFLGGAEGRIQTSQPLDLILAGVYRKPGKGARI